MTGNHSCLLHRSASALAVLVSASALASCTGEAGATQGAVQNDLLEVARETEACQVGTYQSSGGDIVVLREVDGGFLYRFLDGSGGRVEDTNSPLRCGPDLVRVERDGREAETWARIRFRDTITWFELDGTPFFGRLLESAGGNVDRPLVVLGHGSETFATASGEGEEPWPPHASMLVAQGVSVFLYDKRGTGKSGGEFNMNFHSLAHDMVAAAAEARRLAAGRYGRFGLVGFSQSGWVVPLAARQVEPDFLLVAYGALYSPSEEAGEEIHAELQEAGYGEEVLSRARRLTDALAVVRASDGQHGLDQLARFKRQYGGEPWFQIIERRGDWSGHLIRASDEQLRREPLGNSLGIPFRHDGMDVARSLSVPQLWILAEEDLIAPIRLTLQRIPLLQAEGVPIRMVVFPRTDHGMREFVRDEAGRRVYTRFADGYFRLMADWAKGVLAPPYGDATIPQPLHSGPAPELSALGVPR